MALNKETVYATLFARLSSSVTGTNTASRRLRHFDNVPPAEQPALFVDQVDVVGQGDVGKPSRQVVRADVYIYVHRDDDTGPIQDLNGFVLQVEEALERKADDPLSVGRGATTLSGTVASARVTSIEYSSGDLGPQGVAKIGIEMIAGS